MGKGRFATHSRFNFLYKFLYFSKFSGRFKILPSKYEILKISILAYLTHGKSRNLSSVCGA